MTKINIYTTPSCHYCHMTKDYLNSRGIDYSEFNVSRDEKAREKMVRISGQLGVPVITVGKEVVMGFDPRRLEELLKRAGQKISTE